MNKINNSDSIFAIYGKEIKKINKKSFGKRVLNLEELSIEQKKIISIINTFKVITLKQIKKLLKIEGREYTIEIIEESILKLLNNNIIESTDVYDENGTIKFTFYYIINILCAEGRIDNYKNKNLIQVKKRLQGNEIIIAFLSKLNKGIIDFKIDNRLTSKRFCKFFIVEGANIIIKQKDKVFNILYEVIRREEDWKEKTVNKLKLYKSFYDELVVDNQEFLVVPHLVLVCEDEKHMEELIEEMLDKKCIIQRLKLYMSTDHKIKTDILNSIIEIKYNQEDKEYEKKCRKIKIK